MDTELIQLKGVTKKFGKNVVLDSINLNIPEGKITGIIGASGEGKTTILKLLVGFYKPNSGEITYRKRSVLKDISTIEKIFGFSTEDGSFYEKLTVWENIFYFGRMHKLKRSEIIKRGKELAGLVGLDKALRTQAQNLSVGMKKRLDIACALIHSPQVLIMDEPTADLDPLLRDNILEVIKKINRDGTTVIMTTQILEEMDKVCDRIAILYNEKIIEQDVPSKIKSKYGSSNMNDVFDKIFSRRTRKTYETSKVEKTPAKEEVKVEEKKVVEVQKDLNNQVKKPEKKAEDKNVKENDEEEDFSEDDEK